MNKDFCDPETGICTPAALEGNEASIPQSEKPEIIYVGDPMCSWCWGISKELTALKDHFTQYTFTVVLGGLRPGGGDPWDEKMKSFLKHHWEEVTARSGQPFGYKLFNKEYFNYDTEPSCRAVVASRPWMKTNELAFFEAVARRFYVENEDPNEVEFYQPICASFDIPFSEFKKSFDSDQTKYLTNQDFQLNRQWGVTGYPTVLFKHKEQLYQINHGYSEFQDMKRIIEKITKPKIITA